MTEENDTGTKGSPYAVALISFWETMQALRDLAASIGPIAKDLDSYDQIGEEFASHLPPSDRDRFMEQWTASREDRVSDVPEGTEEETEAREVDLQDLVEKAAEADNPVVLTALLTLARLRRRAPRSFYIYQSLLAMAVGSFELLLGRVWSAFFEDRPEMLDDREKRFSLSDLSEFESIDDALDWAIEKKVDALLLNSFDDWAKWFSDQKVTDFSESAISWETAREIVQRRHVVVHNGGRVSRRYKENVGESVSNLEVGTVLWTDEAYLNRALDELIVLGAQIAGSVWLKLHPDEREKMTSFLLTEIVYELMRGERWEAVAHLSERTREVAQRDYTVSALQCNEWHARKMLFGLDAIRVEVEEWDTSAASDLFRMVKACLLNDMDSAFELVGSVLESKAITSEELRLWPIFAPMRDDARYLLIARSDGQTNEEEE